VYKCDVAHLNNFLNEELGKNLIFRSTWYIGTFLPEDRTVIKFKQETETHDEVTRRQVVLFASNHETACGQVLSSRGCLRHLVTLHPPCICDDFSIPGNTTKAHELSSCVLNLLTLQKKNETIYYVGTVSTNVYEIRNICPTFIQLSEKL